MRYPLLTIKNELGKVLPWQFIQKDSKLFVISLHPYTAKDGLDGGSSGLASAHGSQQVGGYVSHDAATTQSLSVAYLSRKGLTESTETFINEIITSLTL